MPPPCAPWPAPSRPATPYTGKHAERVTAYGIEIGRAFGLPRPAAPEIEFGYLLHDIGKVAIPDAILYKPGALDADERALMSRHPLIGAEMVSGIEFLADAVKVVRSHHERWDGTGYPDGLAGADDPPRCTRVRGRRRARRPDHGSALPVGLTARRSP